MKFSERHGYRKVSDVIIREDVTASQRTGIWNVLKTYAWDLWEEYQYGWTPESQIINEYLHRLWIYHFKADLDNLPVFISRRGGKDGYQTIKEHFFRAKWYEVFDFLEFTSKELIPLFHGGCRGDINHMLEREGSAYRMVEDEVVEVTDKQELLAIEEGLAIPTSAIKSHLLRSLELLSDRESPDYRNSIKEAVSAVEAACRRLAEDDKATLGQALKKIDGLHPAMASGFSSLYGFTSDKGGIRHALSDDPSVSYEDAKFMLVACSAFVSFLEAKHAKQI